MLISIYNEDLDRWEVKEYDTLTEDGKMMYEQYRSDEERRKYGDRIKAAFEIEPPGRPEARKIYEGEYPELPKSMQDKKVSRETESRVACMSFTDAFYEAAKTNPVYRSVAMQIRQGNSPYEVIEVLLKDRQTLAECIGKLTVQLGEAEMKLLKLQHGNKARS